MPLSLTLFVDPCHSQLEVVLHPLIDIIHVLHSQTRCITLSFQFLNPDLRSLIFLLHFLHLGDQSLNDTLELLDLALMVHLLCHTC